MKIIKPIILFVFSFFLCMNCTYASLERGTPQSISASELQGFNQYPQNIQRLITQALTLASRNLSYQYGSADPKNGAMDCSGTIYYLLQTFSGSDIPRSSDEMYTWAIKNGKFHTVKSNAFDSSEFADLKPGDLLFWSGTYATKKASAISHVMMYLGKNAEGDRLMFGASDGRTYKGKQIWGVSVFDFRLPATDSKSHFIGYSCIPNVSCS